MGIEKDKYAVEGTVEEKEDGAVTVSLGSDEAGGDDDEVDEPAAAGSEPRPSRQERRRERGNAHKEALRIAQEEREARIRLEGHVGNLTQQLQALGRPQRDAEPDADEASIADYDQRIQEMSELFDRLPPEQQNARRQEFREKYSKIESNKKQAEFRVFARKNGYLAPGQQQRAPNVNAAAMEAIVAARHSDVYGNPKALQYARLLAQQHQLKGGADGQEAVDEIMERTRKEFGMQSRRKAAPVDDGDRRRLGGTSVGGAGGGGKSVQLDKAMVAHAKAAFPHAKSDAEAIKLWTRGQVKAGTM
jgi:hypothetical protein